MNTTKRKYGVYKVLMGWFSVIVAIALLSSCSLKPEDAIVGKWKETDGNETIEFFRDGTFIMADEELPIEGTYKFIDKDRIRIKFEGIGGFY
jgi:uncharacterized protein (DUF2147 family)